MILWILLKKVECWGKIVLQRNVAKVAGTDLGRLADRWKEAAYCREVQSTDICFIRYVQIFTIYTIYVQYLQYIFIYNQSVSIQNSCQFVCSAQCKEAFVKRWHAVWFYVCSPSQYHIVVPYNQHCSQMFFADLRRSLPKDDLVFLLVVHLDSLRPSLDWCLRVRWSICSASFGNQLTNLFATNCY